MAGPGVALAVTVFSSSSVRRFLGRGASVGPKGQGSSLGWSPFTFSSHHLRPLELGVMGCQEGFLTLDSVLDAQEICRIQNGPGSR